MVKPGQYSAKVFDYKVDRVDSEGRPIIEVWFEVEGQGQVKWAGFMSPKAIERTLESLAYMGFAGTDLSELAEGKTSGALDLTTPVNITVDWQTDKQGKKSDKYTQVRFINRSSLTQSSDPQVSARAKAGLKEFSGEWARIRAEHGIKPKSKAVDL